MRSKLFVPASRPELFAKALAGPADAISFDLEDAVDESRKPEARDALAKFLRGLGPRHGKTLIVRVNAIGTPHFEDDIAAVVGPGCDVVNLPKPEGADQVRECSDAISQAERGFSGGRTGILVNIETPRALRLAAELAGASSRVVGLQAGWGDLLEPLGMDRHDPATVHQLLVQIRVAAGEAGVFAYDGAWADIQDPEGYRREAEAARRLGYLGKSAIHPSQVPIANEVFRPTDAEIAHSLKVVQAAREAAARGIGAFTVGGKMVDAPFVRRAEAVLEVARKLGLVAPGEGTIE